MPYALGKTSLEKLAQVKNELAAVVMQAITITTQDFTVQEGLRTIETQRKYFAKGVTRTMKSYHLDGKAVDLVPWIAGGPRWEWNPIYEIAAAMRNALFALNEIRMGQNLKPLKITWGGVWDRSLGDFPGNAAGMKQAVIEYQSRHPGPDFIDGPHFQLEKS